MFQTFKKSKLICIFVIINFKWFQFIWITLKIELFQTDIEQNSLSKLF